MAEQVTAASASLVRVNSNTVLSIPADATPEERQMEEALKASSEARARLSKAFEDTLKDVWTDALRALESALPHSKGDGSANERLYQAHRNRILNKGNAAVRSLPDLLDCYVVYQVAEHKVVKVVIQGHGPYNLPPNVKLRDQKNPA